MVRWKRMAMVAVALGLCAGPLSAATWTSWSGGTNCTGTPACESAITSNFGNSRTGTASGTFSVTATAWSFTGSSSNTTLENAYLSLWSGGLGVTNRDYTSDPELSSPNHALDNANRADYILFNFNAPTGSLVNLTSVTAGWVESDADITVLAYTGTGTPPSLAGKTRSQLLTDGWQLVGHYGCSNLGCSSAAEPQTVTLNTTVSSNYWLIGAYDANSALANAAKTFGSPNASPYDYLKIASISGTETKRVPEPGSAALVGSALLAGLLAFRRSRSRALRS